MWPQEILNRVFEAATNRLRVSAQSPELETKVDILNNKVDTLGADIKAIKDTAGIKKITDPVGIDPTNNTVQLSGSIPEYAWFTGAEQPIPADQTKFAWGYEFDETTGEISAYGWSGAAWVKAVI